MELHNDVLMVMSSIIVGVGLLYGITGIHGLISELWESRR